MHDEIEEDYSVYSENYYGYLIVIYSEYANEFYYSIDGGYDDIPHPTLFDCLDAARGEIDDLLDN